MSPRIAIRPGVRVELSKDATWIGTAVKPYAFADGSPGWLVKWDHTGQTLLSPEADLRAVDG